MRQKLRMGRRQPLNRPICRNAKLSPRCTAQLLGNQHTTLVRKRNPPAVKQRIDVRGKQQSVENIQALIVRCALGTGLDVGSA